MKKKIKLLNTILNMTLYSFVLLLLIENYSSYEIKAQWIKTTSYLVIFIIPTIVILINFIIIKGIYLKIFTSIIPILFVVGVVISNPLKLLFQSSVYKTQHIYYINNKHPNKKVEFQMQDMGAFGYNKREVEATHFFGLFMKIKHIDQIKYDTTEWRKVDIQLNELEIKYP